MEGQEDYKKLKPYSSEVTKEGEELKDNRSFFIFGVVFFKLEYGVFL